MHSSDVESDKLKIKCNISIKNTETLKIKIIQELEYIIYNIQLKNEKNGPFRIRQYNEMIKNINNFPGEHIPSYQSFIDFYHSLTTKKSKILDKIKEYFDTGVIKESEKAKINPKIQCIINLTKVYGIGPKKSLELYDNYKIVNVEQLKLYEKKDTSIINSKQKIGLEHYYDLNERIPISEMKIYDKVLRQVCNEISPSIIMSINGSYRRGLSSSGDIDLLITSKTQDTQEIRNKIINQLTKIGIIKETLANGKKKFMGIVQLEMHGYTKSRHIDIMDTKPEHYPFAVLYFTGSGTFNAYMRGIALKKGYSLNEYCLSDKITKLEITKEIIYNKIHKNFFETEEDIFQFLDMEYKDPTQRNI